MPEEKGVEELVEKGEGIMKYKLVVTNTNGDIQYNIENVLNNTANHLWSKRVLEILGETLCKVSYTIV